MYKIRLSLQDKEIFYVSRKILEEATAMREPNYVKDAKGSWQIYGVCPKCKNPVQIWGLYTKNVKPDPHAKHIPHSVDNIAQYSEEDYLLCPYANPKTGKSQASVRRETPETLEMKELIRGNFDKVVYFLCQKINIKLSLNLVERMLSEFAPFGGGGHRYYDLEKHNIPFIFGYLSLAKSLYSQPIRLNSPLYEAILRNCANAQFCSSYDKDYYFLKSKPRKFLKLDFSFILYKDDRYGETGEESIIFSVFIPNEKDMTADDSDKHLHTYIFKEKIIIDNHFENLLEYAKNSGHERSKSKRDLELLELAKKYFI